MKDVCTHPYGSFKEMCTLCGQRLQAESGVALGYIHEVKTIWQSCEFWLSFTAYWNLEDNISDTCEIFNLSRYHPLSMSCHFLFT